MKNVLKINNKGITLIALVVTIIVLIILAGISVNFVLGENGIIARAKRAKNDAKMASYEEIIKLAHTEVTIKSKNENVDFLEEIENIIKNDSILSDADIKNVDYENKDSLLIKKEEYIYIANKDKVECISDTDKVSPKATIQIDKTTAGVGQGIPAIVAQNDDFGEIDVQSCKWVFVKESSAIGTDASLYTGGGFTEETETITVKGTEEGTYYLHVLTVDKAQNKVETISSGVELNSYSFSQTFNYSGNIQSFTIPESGIYKLEVWGAQGGLAYESGEKQSVTAVGAQGGYTYGYKRLEKGTIIYIGIGQQGIESRDGSNDEIAAYNGGGKSDVHYTNYTHAGGGGATHIAITKNRGVLANYASYQNEVLIVAGGGTGGIAMCSDTSKGILKKAGALSGNHGNSANGGTCYHYGDAYDNRHDGRTGWATVTVLPTPCWPGSFGQGAYGAGGGWQGGGGHRLSDGSHPGANTCQAGTGYIGGVPSITVDGVTYNPAIVVGGRNGHGQAKITFAAF